MDAHVGSLGNKPEHTAILLPERPLAICDADPVYLFSQSIFCDLRQGAEAVEGENSFRTRLYTYKKSILSTIPRPATAR